MLWSNCSLDCFVPTSNCDQDTLQWMLWLLVVITCCDYLLWCLHDIVLYRFIHWPGEIWMLLPEISTVIKCLPSLPLTKPPLSHSTLHQQQEERIWINNNQGNNLSQSSVLLEVAPSLSVRVLWQVSRHGRINPHPDNQTHHKKQLLPPPPSPQWIIILVSQPHLLLNKHQTQPLEPSQNTDNLSSNPQNQTPQPRPQHRADKVWTPPKGTRAPRSWLELHSGTRKSRREKRVNSQTCRMKCSRGKRILQCTNKMVVGDVM